MKNSIAFSLLFVSLLLLFVIDVIFGSVSIPFNDFIDLLNGKTISKSYELIIMDSRIPKALTAILCGASLSLAGLLMQTLFRNPLAGPYILGISSGAGLGVAILVMGAGFLGITITSGLSTNLAAVLGAITFLIILFLVSLKVKDVMTLLIFGVMLGSISTAIIGLIKFFSTDYQLKSFVIWTLGSLSAVSYMELTILGLLLFFGILLAFQQAKNLNAILIGENFAKVLGVSILNTRLISILISGLLAGLTTALCGPIGFVGIIIPHLCRMIFRTSNHFILIPSCILLGANILLLSDILAHLPSNGLSLPINSITSMIGIPIILWIIFGKKALSKSF
ncbi:MAG: iron ABC transporter permease [Flavobacteriales bacterium]|nr:iron ABC transporter permease [Flavobacteriales bacterium]